MSQIGRYNVHTITGKVIARDSKYSLFSILVNFHGCNFDKATNIQQLSQDCTQAFFLFLSKTSFPNFELPNLGAVFTITVLFLSISMMT